MLKDVDSSFSGSLTLMNKWIKSLKKLHCFFQVISSMLMIKRSWENCWERRWLSSICFYHRDYETDLNCKQIMCIAKYDSGSKEQRLFSCPQCICIEVCWLRGFVMLANQSFNGDLEPSSSSIPRYLDRALLYRICLPFNAKRKKIGPKLKKGTENTQKPLCPL